MRRLLALGLGCLASVTASSEDLLTIFDQAVVNDPLVREAEFTRKATREARPQAWAAYLPQISGSYNKGESEGSRHITGAQLDRRIPNNPGRLILQPIRGSNSSFAPETSGWGIQLRQTHLQLGRAGRPQAVGAIAAQADADYGVAQQDLALRVSTRYFDVLAAQDNVQAQQASLDAISRQLEQADKRFEVGLIAITDVQEARAARDTAAADLIAAKRQLATSQELLREITDMQYAGARHAARHHAARHSGARRSAEMGRGVDGAEPGADLEPARRGHRARRRARARSAATCRTVDLVRRASRTARATTSKTFAAVPGVSARRHRCHRARIATPTSPSACRSRCPSGRAAARSRACASQSYRWQAAKQRLERVSRETERTARDAYLGVMSEISRVQALKQALESSATALRPPRPAMTWARAPRSTCSPRASSWSQAQTALLAQPLRLHAQRAAPQAVRRHPRSQGARRREHLAGDAAAAGQSAGRRSRRARATRSSELA